MEGLRAEADKQQLWLLDCIYLDHVKSERIFRFVDQTEQAISDAASESEEHFSDYVCSELMVEIPRYKDETFVSEREWRLFVYDNVLDADEKVGFSVDSRGIFPHREFPFEGSIVKEIVLHPRADEAAIFGMNEFLQSLNLQNVSVRRSKVPLRY
jgi:hypothetical protein